MANIKVAVRVRPISEREFKYTGSEIVLHTDDKEVSLTNLKVPIHKAGDSRKRKKTYKFDYCFDSSNPNSTNYANQSLVYKALGKSVLDAAFSGFNACLVAYGQSASGKTYTMMGTKDDPGLIPRLCKDLFVRRCLQPETDVEVVSHQIFLSYLEIYNEKVRDLLKPSSSSSRLRVREHPRLGPYVQGLTHHLVSNLGSLMSYIEDGTKARKTASTLQNPNSSRSHALLTVSLAPVPQNGRSLSSPLVATKRKDWHCGNRLHLVDLAGSESAVTCSGIHRLKEGANINKSLVALGNVISALAERGSAESALGRRYIPYRDSSLTWLLKDALGGNATTIMLATISPASGSYNETAHTLRFAQRAQCVVNKPVVNEDPIARTIRELRAEVARLQSLLTEQNISTDTQICHCKGNFEEKKDPIKNRENNSEDVDEKSTSSSINIAEASTIASPSLGVVSIRKCSSNESLSRRDVETGARASGSLESLSATGVREIRGGYNRTESNDVQEDPFQSCSVDIPTLVAVLIRSEDVNDDNGRRDSSSTKIKDICSDDTFVEVEEQENSSIALSDDSLTTKISEDNRQRLASSSRLKDVEPEAKEGKLVVAERKVLKKQGSVDGFYFSRKTPRSLKRYNSIETLSKNVDKLESKEKVKKLKDIEEVVKKKPVDERFSGRQERSVALRRKHSVDDSQKLRGWVRKTSVDGSGEKRKTSKDSSSSSSKEDRLSVSSVTGQRKGSLEQELAKKLHTPIQRSSRAEIVAAVTRRLYSSGKKTTDDNAIATPPSTISTPSLELRSPESTEVKLEPSTRMRLQEISRKMLAKRRKICVETQTDNEQTVRVRDTASLTDKDPKILKADAEMLTDEHEELNLFLEKKLAPVRIVKEIATLTERQPMPITRYRDVTCYTEDYDEESDTSTIFNDSGISSDIPRTYSNSNFSYFENLGIYDNPQVERSTSTYEDSLPDTTNAFVQTLLEDTLNVKPANTPVYLPYYHCCSNVNKISSPAKELTTPTEQNQVYIDLPEDIRITIKSADSLKSKISLVDDDDYAKKTLLRNSQILSDLELKSEKGEVSKDTNEASTLTSSFSETQGNILKNLETKEKGKSRLDIVVQGEKFPSKNALNLTNIVGTSSAIQIGRNHHFTGLNASSQTESSRFIPTSNEKEHGSRIHELLDILLEEIMLDTSLETDLGSDNEQMAQESSSSIGHSWKDPYFSDDSLEFCDSAILRQYENDSLNKNYVNETEEDFLSMMQEHERVPRMSDQKLKKKVSFTDKMNVSVENDAGESSEAQPILKKMSENCVPESTFSETEKVDKFSMDHLEDDKLLNKRRNNVEGKSSSGDENKILPPPESMYLTQNDPDNDNSIDTHYKTILNNYLDEALIFMQNLDYDLLEDKPNHRKSSEVWDDFEKMLNVIDEVEELCDESIISMPDKSYEECLNSISRLENCMKDIEKHDIFLRDNYGIDLKSSDHSKSSLSNAYRPDSMLNRQVNYPGIWGKSDDASLIKKKQLASHNLSFSEDSISEKDLSWKFAKPRSRSKKALQTSKLGIRNPFSHSKLRRMHYNKAANSVGLASNDELHSNLNSVFRKNEFCPSADNFEFSESFKKSNCDFESKSLKFSKDDIGRLRQRSKLSGKCPREKFMYFLRERRKIVESSRKN